MNKTIWLVAGGAVTLGLLVGVSVASIVGHNRYDGHMKDKSHDTHEMKHMSDKATTPTHDMATMMHDMNAALEGKTGAEFDAIFLREMIVHHEGAVDMAKAALDQAGDERIKQLAREIIATQETEIAAMKSWQEK
ncbi:MAG: hypothetical protein RLZZ70_329 [Candidatus Parcubacteria bacterium]|jgi:uncharacterized protein (DUF305 family)